MNAERRVEVTSSGFFFDPEPLFYLTGEINRTRPRDAQIGLELYSVVKTLPPFHKIPYLKNRRFVREHGIAFERDGRISLDKIHNWWKEYGHGEEMPVKRIHLPFHYSIPSGLRNYFWYSMVPFAKPYEPGNRKDRAIASAVAWMTMTAMNGFATGLATELGAEQNVHVNIVEEAAKRGNLIEVLAGNRTLTENAADYTREDFEENEAQINPERAFVAVRKYFLQGVIYGADHEYRSGKDPRILFDRHRKGFDKYLRVIHLSGSQGDHGLITDEDHEFWSFIDHIKDKISNDVIFCLDLDPFQMDHLTKAQQVDYIRNLVKKLESY